MVMTGRPGADPSSLLYASPAPSALLAVMRTTTVDRKRRGRQPPYFGVMATIRSSIAPIFAARGAEASAATAEHDEVGQRLIKNS